MAALIVMMTAALGTTSCSVLVDLDECTSESSCVQQYGRGWTCTSENLCERKALLDQSEAGPCSESAGPINEEDTFNIGVMLPLSGEEGGDGRALLSAIKLAQADFNGLSGVGGRPIGLIICDTEGKNDVALEAGEHLVDDAAVEAIIGPNFSSQVVDVATAYTIPNDVLLVSPSATATSISDLDDKGLVWRTTPSDALQAYAIGLLVSDLLEKAEAKSPDEEPVKLSVLTRANDIYAQGLRDSLSLYLPDAVVGGNEHRFTTHEYQNTSAGQGSDYSGVIAEVATEETEPDIVVILGFAEAWEIARQLDQNLEQEPLYVFVDAGRVAEEASKTASDGLEGRVWGTSPRGGDNNYDPWNKFRIKYNSSPEAEGSAENLQYVANAYDAVYAIAFAAAGSGFSGPQIAEGMTQLSNGEVVSATQGDAQKGVSLRGEGREINLQGASGELDWNDKGDPTIGEVSLWCLRNRSVPEEGVLLDRSSTFRPLSCAPDSCLMDTDCPAGHVCEAEQCSPVCVDDEDCVSSQSCTTRSSGSGQVCQ